MNFSFNSWNFICWLFSLLAVAVILFKRFFYFFYEQRLIHHYCFTTCRSLKCWKKIWWFTEIFSSLSAKIEGTHASEYVLLFLICMIYFKFFSQIHGLLPYTRNRAFWRMTWKYHGQKSVGKASSSSMKNISVSLSIVPYFESQKNGSTWILLFLISKTKWKFWILERSILG